MDELTFKEALQQAVAEWYNSDIQRRNIDLYKVGEIIKSIEDKAETTSQNYAKNVEYTEKHPDEEWVKQNLKYHFLELFTAYGTGYADSALNDLIKKKKDGK